MRWKVLVLSNSKLLSQHTFINPLQFLFFHSGFLLHFSFIFLFIFVCLTFIPSMKSSFLIKKKKKYSEKSIQYHNCKDLHRLVQCRVNSPSMDGFCRAFCYKTKVLRKSRLIQNYTSINPPVTSSTTSTGPAYREMKSVFNYSLQLICSLDKPNQFILISVGMHHNDTVQQIHQPTKNEARTKRAKQILYAYEEFC